MIMNLTCYAGVSHSCPINRIVDWQFVNAYTVRSACDYYSLYTNKRETFLLFVIIFILYAQIYFAHYNLPSVFKLDNFEVQF